MSNPLDSVLSQALSVRLNLQISLSSLPVVEEWMDIHLNRWLESVPLPPEMPRGHSAHFGVSIASDLSRMAWRAYGDPAGFVPKLIEYLKACKISRADTALLDQLGNSLEPKLVGSWIAVSDGAITTGWQFCDAHPFTAIEPLFAQSEARGRLVAWMQAAGIERFQRFTQSISENGFSELELEVPGVSIDDQLGQVSRAFEALVGAPLPDHAAEAMSSAVSPGFSVAVRIADGVVSRMAVLSPGLGNDVIAQLAAAAGVGFDNKLARLSHALGADSADQVEYALAVKDGLVWPAINVHMLPTGAAGELLRDPN